jgi:hypothetical protein
MLNVTYKPYILSVFMLNVVMLSVVSPFSEVSMLNKDHDEKVFKDICKNSKVGKVRYERCCYFFSATKNLFCFSNCNYFYIVIRKDCFQVKSNLLTVDNLVFHF